jgi:superoxide reductase
MGKIGDLIKTDDWKTEKHVPVIEVPEDAKQGELTNITVSIGKEIAHPNTTEHFICWIDLYFHPQSGGAVYHLGRVEFLAHGATTEGANAKTLHTAPAACFQVKLDEPGQLLAMSYCNIHGLWEGAAPLSF